MVSKVTKVINPQGFHMRPTGKFCDKLAEFKSDMKIIAGEKKVDAKSMMHLVAAGIKFGHVIEVTADGPDEDEALSTAIAIIESGFYDL